MLAYDVCGVVMHGDALVPAGAGVVHVGVYFSTGLWPLHCVQKQG